MFGVNAGIIIVFIVFHVVRVVRVVRVVLSPRLTKRYKYNGLTAHGFPNIIYILIGEPWRAKPLCA